MPLEHDIHYGIALPEIFHYHLRIRIGRKHLAEPGLSRQNVIGTCKSLLGEQRCQQPVHSGFPCMKRFSHGTKDLLQAAGLGACQSNAIVHPGGIQPEQFSARDRRAEPPDCRCRVPALLVMERQDG